LCVTLNFYRGRALKAPLSVHKIDVSPTNLFANFPVYTTKLKDITATGYYRKYVPCVTHIDDGLI